MTPLHDFGELLRHAFGLLPMGFVRLLFVALPAAVLCWVLWLPPLSADGERRPAPYSLSDLRIWAALALIAQILIYGLV